MTQYKLKSRVSLFAVLMLVFFAMLPSSVIYAQQPSRVVRKADRFFMKGDYDKSMYFYERGLSDLDTDSDSYYTLELKLAQLYSMLQNKPKAIEHYNNIFQNRDSLLTTDDVYLFVDALRRSNMRQSAEKIIRHYAFQGSYYRNQRLINTLNSLSNQSHYYQKGLTSYNVRRLDPASTHSNYWIGEYDSELFFAQSRSKEITSNDKIIYHQTRYRKFGDNLFGEDMVFKNVPIQLQKGPMSYSMDNNLLIVTDISYGDSDEKDFNSVANQGFCSSLLYSQYDSKSDRWSAFKPVFAGVSDVMLYDDDVNIQYSDAHPSFLNENNSLVFASDRPGGYGGMDLYVTHWNSEQEAWGIPENLGAEINSEGDEIYPRISGDALFFASNGLDGFGGYDNYRISFNNNMILSGTLFHYPYPVNSAYNDFGVTFHGDDGFFISDRQENGRDDIFVFIDAPTSLSRDGAIGVSKEYIAMRGNLDAVEQMSSSYILEKRSDVNLNILSADKTEHLHVYFDFDSEALNDATYKQLAELIEDLTVEDIEEIYIVGYTDLLGSREYNERLSLERAKNVANYFQKHLPGIPVEYLGRGVINVSDLEERSINDYMKNTTIGELNIETPLIARKPNNNAIRDMLKHYRRVEIIIKNKK